MAASCQSGTGSSSAAFLFARKYLLPHLAPFLQGRVLELGAGDGGTLAALRALGFREVIGCDASPYQVEQARLRGVSIDLCDAGVVLERTPEASLDAVIALDVLEHLTTEQLDTWMRAARRALAPGGLLVFRVPNGESPFCGAIRYGDLTHRCAFTASSIRQAVGAAGFGEVRLEACRPMVHGPASALRACGWFAFEAGLRSASFLETGRWTDSYFTRNILAVARGAK
jgi:SAM-dependent methyltransferase